MSRKVLQSLLLGDIDPFEVFKFLKKSGPEAVCAFFRVSDPKEEGAFTSRLSVVAVEPSEILQSREGVTTLRSSGQNTTSSQDPFSVFETRLLERRVPALDSLPFFQGGALGYLSYDASRFLEKRLARFALKDDLNSYDAELAFFRTSIVFDHLNGNVFLIHSDRGDELELKKLEARIAEGLKNSAARGPVTNAEVREYSTEEMTSLLGKESFLEGVHRLKHHIAEGDIFQAVLSDRFSKPFRGNPVQLFEVLSRLSPAPYQFYFEIEGRSYLGASPEALIKISGDVLETHPIAGTRPRGKNAEEEKRNEQELLDSVKEKAEHLMLVDLARNDVGRVARPGSVSVDSFMQLRKFGGVMHLVSVVKGKMNSWSHPIRAMASCFPAGTLSGAPKLRAMELISEIEGHKRGFYGGTFVAASVTGDLDSCITIRSIAVENGVASVQVGAGIVADSVPEEEYAEIQHKSKMTRKALAVAEAL